jgi:hypothetical protein
MAIHDLAVSSHAAVGRGYSQPRGRRPWYVFTIAPAKTAPTVSSPVAISTSFRYSRAPWKS